MGVAVLPESAARSLYGAVNGLDVTHYHSFNESLFVLKFTRQSKLVTTGTGSSERVVNVSD